MVNCEQLNYADIVQKCKELGYGDVLKVRYYKHWGDWQYQTLVCNDTEVKQMWEEGVDFSFLKPFIEFKSDPVDLFQNNNTINGLGEDNVFDVLVHENECPEIDVEAHDDGIRDNNAESDDVSLGNDSKTDDDEYLDAIQKQSELENG